MRYPTARAVPGRVAPPGGRLLIPLLALPALAQAPLTPTVLAVGEARSVVVLTSAGAAALCRDDGQQGDPVPGDGQWRCPSLAWAPERDALGVMLDGRRLVRAQAVAPTLSGRVSLTLDGGRLRAEPGTPEPGAPGTAKPPVPALVIDVDRGESRQAWILEVAAASGSGQLACHDDGDFPDAARNDDVPVCAGTAASGDVVLRLRTPAQQLQAERSVGPDVAIVRGRWTDQGLQSSDRALMPELSSTAQAVPLGDALPAPQGGDDGATGPAVKPPDAPSRPGLWAGLLALGAGLVGWRLGRGPRGERALHGSLERVDAPVQMTHVDSLEAAWPVVGSEAPVVLVGLGGVPAQARSGAVLRCRSVDVLDVVDAVRGLAAREPLRAVGLVVAAGSLENPGGLGVTPLELLARELPPNTRCAVVDPASVP